MGPQWIFVYGTLLSEASGSQWIERSQVGLQRPVARAIASSVARALSSEAAVVQWLEYSLVGDHITPVAREIPNHGHGIRGKSSSQPACSVPTTILVASEICCVVVASPHSSGSSSFDSPFIILTRPGIEQDLEKRGLQQQYFWRGSTMEDKPQAVGHMIPAPSCSPLAGALPGKSHRILHCTYPVPFCPNGPAKRRHVEDILGDLFDLEWLEIEGIYADARALWLIRYSSHVRVSPLSLTDIEHKAKSLPRKPACNHGNKVFGCNDLSIQVGFRNSKFRMYVRTTYVQGSLLKRNTEEIFDQKHTIRGNKIHYSICTLWKAYNNENSASLGVKYHFFRNIFIHDSNISFNTPPIDECSGCIRLKALISSANGTKKNDLMVQHRLHKLKSKAFYDILKTERPSVLKLSCDCQKNLLLPKVSDQSACYNRQ
ncbi:hypothetical protein PR048_018132 [Dryococelus australis]|uniref:Gamma-glutamylcyclotransferase AIG2-like domain-containing protein n=1 Tax=Dryococelus australis TaxID=614101 RepID=A0ABQ9HBS1_9NEOP|nr:hypothetical protein PR048_018132 [Dryococelus australis]